MPMNPNDGRNWMRQDRQPAWWRSGDQRSGDPNDDRGPAQYDQGGHGGYGRGYGGYVQGHGRGEGGGGGGIGGHRGKGPLNFTRTDERIYEIVCEALLDDDRIDASNIEVKVSNGEVTLTGTVHDRPSKRLAEDVVEDLPGVQAVENRIRVQRADESVGRDASIEQLNSFLRGEISAVETYRMALEKLDRGSPARSELEACMRSHEERVTLLQNQILRLGGTPATSSGPWGVLAKIIEGGARVLGDKVAIAALEEGEDHGLQDYRDDVDKLDPELKTLVRSRLLPQQENTHSRMSSLKRRLSS
jgi:hypothetical protein